MVQKKHFPPGTKEFYQLPLSDQTKQIILGSLLGDGSLKINKNYRNAKYAERHSITQKEYIEWKVSQLYPELKGALKVRESSRPLSDNQVLHYQSHVSESLTVLHKLTHKRNTKYVRRRWLNKMTPLALAIWWLDDGSNVSRGRQGVICTDGFSIQEVKVLANYLTKVWEVKVRVSVTTRKNGKQFARIWFLNREAYLTFLRIILPHIPVPSMLKKVMICYSDPVLQQRWISEVTSNLPHFKEHIDSAYLEPCKTYTDLVTSTRDLRFFDVFYQTDRFQKMI